MRKTVLISMIALASVALISCNGKANSDNKVDEKPATEQVEVKKGEPIHTTKALFLEKISDFENSSAGWKYLGDKPCIIDFYADWCPPCKAIAPVLEELAKKYQDDIYIYKINVDNEKELAAAFGIQSIPTLLFVPMEGEPTKELGALPKDMFESKISELLKK